MRPHFLAGRQTARSSDLPAAGRLPACGGPPNIVMSPGKYLAVGLNKCPASDGGMGWSLLSLFWEGGAGDKLSLSMKKPSN